MFERGRGSGFAGPFPFLELRDARGFSLVELIAVIVLLGIVAAVAIPRWLGGSGFEERAVRDQIVAALRYAQKSAVSARRTVCVTFSSSPSRLSFAISNAYPAANCTGGSPLVGPDGIALSVAPSNSIVFASSMASFTFDAAGRASAAASVTVTGLPAGMNIAVESETGYVH